MCERAFRPDFIEMLTTRILQQSLFVFCVFSAVFCDDEPVSSLRIIRPKCRFDNDCTTNAFCFNNDNNLPGYCKCLDGYEMFTEGRNYECLEELLLGDRCRKNVQCQVIAGAQAVCADDGFFKTCHCNETVSHQVKNRCYDTKYLGDFCQVDENCLLPENPVGEDKFAICEAKCVCPIGKRPSLSRKRCLEYRKLGQDCDNDAQCEFTENAVCRVTCTCEAGFVRSLDSQRCLKAALKFEEPCVEDAQCSAHLERSICVNNRCSCPHHYHGYLVGCRADVMPGEACFDTGDCLLFKELRDKVNCTCGVCTCLYGKSYTDDICLSGSSLVLGHRVLSVISVLLVLLMKFSFFR